MNEKQGETIRTVTKEEVKLIEGMMEDKLYEHLYKNKTSGLLF